MHDVPITVPRFIRLRDSMLRSASLPLLVSCLGALSLACAKDKDKDKQPDAVQLGEPIGAEVQAKGSVPALSLAVAVSKGQDPVPLLPQLVSGVSSAVAGCPAFVSESEKDNENVTAFDFTVTGGKMKIAPKPEASSGVTCVTTALEGKDVGAKDVASLAGRVEIKLSSASAKAP